MEDLLPSTWTIADYEAEYLLNDYAVRRDHKTKVHAAIEAGRPVCLVNTNHSSSPRALAFTFLYLAAVFAVVVGALLMAFCWPGIF